MPIELGAIVVPTQYNPDIKSGCFGKVRQIIAQIGLDNRNPPWTIWVEWNNGHIRQEIFVKRGLGTGKYLATCKKRSTKNQTAKS